MSEESIDAGTSGPLEAKGFAASDETSRPVVGAAPIELEAPNATEV